MHRLRTLVGITAFWLALSLLGDGFSSLIVPVRLASIVDPAWAATFIGLVTAAGLVAGMLVQPIAGAISDALYPRWGRRGPLVLTAAMIVAALAIFSAFDGAVGISLSFVLLMIAVSSAQAVQQGFIPDRIDPAWRGRASGAKGLADLGGAFLGFLLLGLLLAGGDAGPAVLAVAALVVATVAVTVVLVHEPDRQPGPRRPVSLTSAYRIDLTAHAEFVRVVAARFFFLLGTFAIGRFFLLFVADRLHLQPAQAGDETGSLLAVLTLISAISALGAGWVADRASATAVMVAGSVLSALGAAALLVAGSSLEILAFGGLMAVGSGAFATANWKLTSDLVPGDEAARFFGLANFGTAGAAAAAGLVGPLADLSRNLAPEVGYGFVFVAAVLSFAASVAVVRPLLATWPARDVRLATATTEGSERW